MSVSENDIDREMDSLVGTMAISGFTLNDDCIASCRAILRGEADATELIAELIEKYRTEQAQ